MKTRISLIFVTLSLLLAGVIAVGWIGGLGERASEFAEPVPVGPSVRVSFALDASTLALCVQRDLVVGDLSADERNAVAAGRRYDINRFYGFELSFGRRGDSRAGILMQAADMVSIGVPNALALIVLLLLPGIYFARRARAKRRVREGRCLACGYDLRATIGRCPECGTMSLIPACTA